MKIRFATPADVPARGARYRLLVAFRKWAERRGVVELNVRMLCGPTRDEPTHRHCSYDDERSAATEATGRGIQEGRMTGDETSGALLAQHRRAWLLWLCIILSAALASACAIAAETVDHAFSFDARRDSPDIEVLDYRYGVRKPGYWMYSSGQKMPQNDNINGWFPRGDSLYVKWRIRSSGEIFEDTVDLRSRLPADITGQRIHFVIKGSQLYVYLRRNAGQRIGLRTDRGDMTTEK